MRRVLAILGATALLFALPGGAAANAPTKETDHTRDAGCSSVATPLGLADFSAYGSALYGTDADIVVWQGEPYNSDPVLSRDWDLPATVTFGSGTVSMSIPVVPAGVVTVTGTLTPVDTITWDDNFRDGNSWYRSSGNGTAFSFSGTLTLPGVNGPVAFGPEECFGSEIDQTTFATQPHARVASYSSTEGRCELANADGDTGFIFGSGDGSFLSINGFVTDSGGSEIGFYGDGEVAADGSVAITVTEYDIETGEPIGTTGTATMSVIDTGETFSTTMRTSIGFERARGTIIDVDGTLETSLGSFSLNDCVAANADTKYVEAPTSGPKPGGKRPANDLPSGAVVMKPGSRATVATKGAQAPREANYPCLQFLDEGGALVEIPVVHTVWYKVAGTGLPVTVDTAGSDFDTVMAVYAGSADASSTVACVDDVPVVPFGRTLQSAATFATVKGTTYWVQIGGFDEAGIFGDTRFLPYGTLKVAVR